jgi:hypothetical protein
VNTFGTRRYTENGGIRMSYLSRSDSQFSDMEFLGYMNRYDKNSESLIAV